MDLHSKINNTIETPVSKEFFSQENIDRIQTDLVYRVREDTKQIISHQNEAQLLVLMRDVMNTYGEYGIKKTPSDSHLSDKSKVRLLNDKVVDMAADIVKKGMISYLKYIKDASSLPVPIPRAQMTSIDNSMEMNKRFF